MACPHGAEEAACAICQATGDALEPTLRRAAGAPAGGGEDSASTLPHRIGRFLILEVLGRGGMGVVYAAYDPTLDRRVAIKVLRVRPGIQSDTDGTSRMLREAQAMAQLSHPNVVPIYDAGPLDGSIFLAMELIAGQTLNDWLKERPRGWREVLAAFLDAGKGLAAAHAAGLVHRDFKPVNVLVGSDGRARVTDFGLVRSERREATLGDDAPPEGGGRSPRTAAPERATPQTGGQASSLHLAATGAPEPAAPTAAHDARERAAAPAAATDAKNAAGLEPNAAPPGDKAATPEVARAGDLQPAAASPAGARPAAGQPPSADAHSPSSTAQAILRAANRAPSLETPLTVAGTVMGTPGYMAPEQYAGRATSAATDQFSFAVALYQALYGARPFAADDVQGLARLTQRGELSPPPRSAAVPGWIFPRLARALAPLPEDRYPSMGALLEALGSDPGVARRRGAVATVLVLVAVAGVAALWQQPRRAERACEEETQQQAAVWSEAERARAEQAFLATGQPFAATAWANARTALDSFVAAWVSERREACAATWSRGEQSRTQLALRLSCLDRRRTELATLASSFGSATQALVAEAALAATQLTPVSTCANLRALERRAQGSAEGQRAADHLEAQLAEGRMLVALGRFDAARARVEPAVAEARALGDLATLGLALLELGRLERAATHFEAARAALDEATRVALTSGDEETAAFALATQVSVVGWPLEKPQEALALANVARGLLPRLSRARAVTALLDEAEGDALWQAADNLRALEAYRKSLAALLDEQGAQGPDVARLQGSLAWMLMERGNLAEARPLLLASKANREAILGPEHPVMSKAWMDLAELAFLQEDFAEALRCARMARDLAVRSQRSEPLLGLGGTLSVGRALTELGELEAAGHELEAAQPLVEKMPGAYVKSEWLRLRAQLELARGEPVAAVNTAQRALDTAGPLFDGRVEGAQMRLVLGRALLATHRAQEALAVLTEARAASERRGALPGPVFVALAVQQSLTEAAVGRLDEALASAERAVTMLEGIEGNPRLRAQAQLTAARARWAKGAARGKAVEEAQQALATAQAAKLEPLEQEARAWLLAHPAP